MLESIQMPAVFFPVQLKSYPLKDKDEHQPHSLVSPLLSKHLLGSFSRSQVQIIALIKHFDKMLSRNNVMLTLPHLQRKEEPSTVLMMHILHYIKAAVGKCLHHQQFQMQRWISFCFSHPLLSRSETLTTCFLHMYISSSSSSQSVPESHTYPVCSLMSHRPDLLQSGEWESLNESRSL